MFPISNDDYKKVLRLLKTLSRIQAGNLREKEGRRQAHLLLRKWERKTISKGVSTER